MHFEHLLLLLCTHSHYWPIKERTGVFFYLHVHQIYLFYFEITVAEPVVDIFAHAALDVRELGDIGIYIAKQKGDLVLSLVEFEVGVHQREGTPTDHIVLFCLLILE